MSLNLQIHLKWIIEAIVYRCQGQVNHNRKRNMRFMISNIQIDFIFSSHLYLSRTSHLSYIYILNKRNVLLNCTFIKNQRRTKNNLYSFSFQNVIKMVLLITSSFFLFVLRLYTHTFTKL